MTAPVVAGDKRMTVREVAEALGVDTRTVGRHIRAIRGNSGIDSPVEQGKTTYLTEAEVTEIKRRIERSGRFDLPGVVQASRRMTVGEVCEALGVDHSTVSRHLKAIRESDLCNVAKVENGKTTYLTEAEVTEIKRRIERSGRNDLASVDQAARATTELERRLLVAQAVQILQEDLASARADLAAAAPKVEFFDTVANSKDAITMRDVAAALNIPGWGRNQIFAFLRDRGILDDRNIPYREYQDRGYFRVVERTWSDPKGETHIALTTLVYQKGVDFIRRTIQEPVRAGAQA